MPLEHLRRLRLARRPDCDTRVLPAGGDAAVAEEDSRVDRVVMEAQDLLGRVVRGRPAEHRGIEASGNSLRAIRRNRERPDRPAVARNCACARTGTSKRAATIAETRNIIATVEKNQVSVGHMPSARIFSRTGSSRSAPRKAATAERSRRLSTRRKS